MEEKTKRVSIVVFSGEMDKLQAAFIIAVGAASAGMPVDMFFTFWGLSALRDAQAKGGAKSFMEKMFGWMLPKGPSKLPLSKMDMMGIGRAMMKGVMKRKGMTSLPELMEVAQQLGVKLHACEMSMKVLGFSREELTGTVEDVVGVASYIEDASTSNITLFI
jgi:peroxiredoxin family protein